LAALYQKELEEQEEELHSEVESKIIHIEVEEDFKGQEFVHLETATIILLVGLDFKTRFGFL